MIDGMKIILERMKTHPEEFENDLGLSSRWENLVQMYNRILTEEEKKAFEDAMHELRRQRFTARVLEVLMEEPVTLDRNTYTINNMGQYSGGASVTLNASQQAYGYSTLQEAVLKEQEQKMYEAIQKEYEKLHAQGLASQTKQQKNQSKMEQLLQRVTGSKY